jgi:hypothetical protein
MSQKIFGGNESGKENSKTENIQKKEKKSLSPNDV